MSRMSIGGPCGTIAALCAALFMPVVSAKIALDAPSDYTTGQALHYAITADLNQDGKPDLIVAANGHLTVLLGNGQGFQNPLNGTTGTYYGLAAGDFNGDGKPDLITDLGLLPGNGDGTFQPLLRIPDTENYRVSTADVNGDHKLDLVYAGGAPAGFKVLTGNGDGTFTLRYSAINPLSEFSLPILADFTGDGKLDLAFAGSEGIAWLARGNGDGTFQQRINLNIGTTNVSLGCGDFNGDGKIDLAVSSPTGIRVALGNGNGTFQPAVVLPEGGLYNILVRDINQDGKLDLFTGNTYYLGLGAGAFGAPVHIQKTPPTDFLALGRQVDGADFNGDGWADFTSYVQSVTSNVVTVFYSKGAGEYRQIPNVAEAQLYTSAMATGDFNRDGKIDAVVAGADQDFNAVLQVYLGNNNGTFQPPQSISVAPMQWTSALRTGDLNRDGIADLVVGGEYSSGQPVVRALLGNGSGGFSAGQSYTLSSEIGALTSGDFNGDGKVDVISSGGEVLLGNGVGGFIYGTPVSLPGVFGTQFVAAADFNNDSKLDLAFAVYTTGLAIVLGNGNGTFGPPSFLPTGGTAYCLTVADLNKDGNMDVITADRQTNNAYTFLGNGNGTFQAAKLSGGFGVPFRLVVTDIDQDGKLDLVAANGTVTDITVLPGRGDGNFQSALRYYTGQYGRSVLPADVTGDGKGDLVALGGSSPGSYLMVLRNISE